MSKLHRVPARQIFRPLCFGGGLGEAVCLRPGIVDPGLVMLGCLLGSTQLGAGCNLPGLGTLPVSHHVGGVALYSGGRRLVLPARETGAVIGVQRPTPQERSFLSQLSQQPWGRSKPERDRVSLSPVQWDAVPIRRSTCTSPRAARRRGGRPSSQAASTDRNRAKNSFCRRRLFHDVATFARDLERVLEARERRASASLPRRPPR